MLFSGIAQSYECPDCQKKFATLIPTSILPLLIVVYLTWVLWGSLLAGSFSYEWIGYLCALPLALLSPFLLCGLAERVEAEWIKNKSCPDCSAKLKAVGGGFVDGGFPGTSEVFMYSYSLLLPASLHILIG